MLRATSSQIKSLLTNFYGLLASVWLIKGVPWVDKDNDAIKQPDSQLGGKFNDNTGMGSADDRLCHIVTWSLIGWTHTQDDPWRSLLLHPVKIH